MFDVWHEFDGWATSLGHNFRDLDSRRAINLIMYNLLKDRDVEQRQEVLKLLGLASPAIEEDEVKSYTPAGASGKDRWKAPEGWTPPGWNETASYQSAKAFMGFKQSQEKAK